MKAGKTCQRTSWNNPFINAVVVMLAHKVGSCLNKEQQKRNIFGHTRTFSMKKVTDQVAGKSPCLLKVKTCNQNKVPTQILFTVPIETLTLCRHVITP